MFRAVRDFFAARNVLEVDTPLLSPFAPIDVHIDILETEAIAQQTGYLHSSPEYGMKKLLAMGSPDIFQLSHVYRQGEIGPKHQIEFSMIEWYRSHFSFAQLIEETYQLCLLFLDNLPLETLRYAEAFQKTHSLDPFSCSLQELRARSCELGLESPLEEKESYLTFLWDAVENSLGDHCITCVTHFPGSQAALAKTTTENGINYASRFELYHKGIELANGYHELTDPLEQKHRFVLANQKRVALGKKPLPIDEELLQALKLLQNQDFFGVAVGFDRLMMLRHKTMEIRDILPLCW